MKEQGNFRSMNNGWNNKELNLWQAIHAATNESHLQVRILEAPSEPLATAAMQAPQRRCSSRPVGTSLACSSRIATGPLAAAPPVTASAPAGVFFSAVTVSHRLTSGRYSVLSTLS